MSIKTELKKYTSPTKAKILKGFFKTGPGEYGAGDIFCGITVPQIRKVARQFINIDLSEVEELLHSKIHEERLAALLVLVDKFQKGSIGQKTAIYKLYLKNTHYINNWDLVDLSSSKIIGAYLMGKNKAVLRRLAESKNLWERRMAIVSTFYFIKHDEFMATLQLTEILLQDEHDLIHKACGWMLRELGKKNQSLEEDFLKKHYCQIPRVMLRYAIERFPEDLRKQYLNKS